VAGRGRSNLFSCDNRHPHSTVRAAALRLLMRMRAGPIRDEANPPPLATALAQFRPRPCRKNGSLAVSRHLGHALACVALGAQTYSPIRPGTIAGGDALACAESSAFPAERHRVAGIEAEGLQSQFELVGSTPGRRQIRLEFVRS